MMKKYKRIVLIGFRGAGKSTVGKMLANQLKWTYSSIDEVIRFVSNQTDTIIDCGGGVVEDPSNMDFFKAESLVIWIDANLDDIMNRISGEQNLRPLLTHTELKSDTAENYTNRRPLYREYSDLHFNSSENNPEEICQFIRKEITRRK